MSCLPYKPIFMLTPAPIPTLPYDFTVFVILQPSPLGLLPRQFSQWREKTLETPAILKSGEDPGRGYMILAS